MTWRDRSWSKWQDNGKGSKHRSPDNSNKKKEAAFPSYDRGVASGSSGASSGAPSQEAMFQALMSLASTSKDKAAVEIVEQLIPVELTEDRELKNQQQLLNRIRKVKQRITKKEQLLTSKQEAMQSFLEEMRKHIIAEKQRHATDVATLTQEINDLKEELTQIKAGSSRPTGPEISLESLLEEEEDTTDLKAELAKAKQEALEAQSMAYAMQVQMDTYLQYQQMAAQAGGIVGPPPAEGFHLQKFFHLKSPDLLQQMGRWFSGTPGHPLVLSRPPSLLPREAHLMAEPGLYRRNTLAKGPMVWKWRHPTWATWIDCPGEQLCRLLEHWWTSIPWTKF